MSSRSVIISSNNIEYVNVYLVVDDQQQTVKSDFARVRFEKVIGIRCFKVSTKSKHYPDQAKLSSTRPNHAAVLGMRTNIMLIPITVDCLPFS